MEGLGERGPSWAGVPVQRGGLGEGLSLIDAAGELLPLPPPPAPAT